MLIATDRARKGNRKTVDIRSVGILQQNTSRDVLNHMIRTHSGIKAYKSTLAKAAGCHLSFLSLVLTGKNLLSTEHAAALCHFWGFNETETDFFITLVNMEKASTSLLTSKYRRDLDTIRLHAAERYVHPGDPESGEALSHEHIVQYSSNWHFPVLHLAVDLPGLNKAEALSKRFYLPLSVVEKALEALLKMGLVTCDRDIWKFRQFALFPKADRTFYKNFHKEIRDKAATEYIQASRHDRLFYTSYFAISNRDRVWITERLRDCLTDISTRLANTDGQAEDVFFLCMDFFNT